MVFTHATQAVTKVVLSLPFDLPDPDPVQPPGTEGLTSIMRWAKWIALAVCLLGLFAGGALMAIRSGRGEGGEHVDKIVISAAASLVG